MLHREHSSLNLEPYRSPFNFKAPANFLIIIVSTTDLCITHSVGYAIQYILFSSLYNYGYLLYLSLFINYTYKVLYLSLFK